MTIYERDESRSVVRTFVLIFGILYAVIGILGFVPGLVQQPAPGAPDLVVDAGYGYLFGLFPVNIIHNIIHLGTGLLGIVAYRSYDAAKTYSRVVAIVFALLTVMGVLPIFQTTFGLAPLFSHDVWLHALTAAATGIFGFLIARQPARETA